MLLSNGRKYPAFPFPLPQTLPTAQGLVLSMLSSMKSPKQLCLILVSETTTTLITGVSLDSYFMTLCINSLSSGWCDLVD